MGLCSSSPDAPPNPTHIDLSHFHLLKVVGKGGFGKVNAIQRRENGELLALKRMAKAEVVKKESHLRMVWTERDIMARLHSPFLVNLVHAFQDSRELYLCMPFMQGGDLRFHLSRLGCLPEEDAKFYAAEILLGLEAMHALNIVYRDLKPDNLLLDSTGHLRVSDFGLSVELKAANGYKIRGNAGTAGYLAIELQLGEAYGTSVDVWTYGIVVYEMIHGRRPFKQWKPSEGGEPMPTLRFGANVSPACQQLLHGLLQPSPHKRLGCGPNGWEDVKRHPWFANIDWDEIAARTRKPPITPDPNQANCRNDADLADQLMDVEPPEIPAEQQKLLVGFDYNTDYKAFQANREREARLAGLNLSQSETVESGPVPSNASHIHTSPCDGGHHAPNGGTVKVAPAPATTPAATHAVQGDKLAPPNTALHSGSANAASRSPSNSANSSRPSPRGVTGGTGAATTEQQAPTKSAAAPLSVPPLSTPTDTPSPSTATTELTASARKYAVGNETGQQKDKDAATDAAADPAAASPASLSSALVAPTAVSGSPAVAAPAPLSRPVSPMTSSRARSQAAKNEIPFTRHVVHASTSN